MAHGFLQQSINAGLLGLVLGYLAVQSESLFPGVIFHFLHNSLMVLTDKVTPELIGRFPLLGILCRRAARDRSIPGRSTWSPA